MKPVVGEPVTEPPAPPPPDLASAPTRPSRLLQPVRHLLLAVQFFTRIPITGGLAHWVGFSPEALRASAAYFPAVGCVVGAFSALVFWGAIALLPEQPAAHWLAAVLGTAASVWITGGFHEDGLADLADGLGGSMERERALAIMKDSRLGTFGALALVLALVCKLVLLVLLAQTAGVALVLLALFAAHAVSRAAPLCLIRWLPHVGDTATSKSKPLADKIGGASLLVGGLWGLAALAGVWWWAPQAPWAWAALGVALACAWVGRLLQRRLQGFTGDGLGAAQQLSELGFYLGLCGGFA